MSHELVIYADVFVTYKDRYGKWYYGDVPVSRFNETTKRFEPVENHRGLAYAKRHDVKYRKRALS